MRDNIQNNESVITALLTTRTNREASKIAGISEATLYRLFKNPQFIEMLEAAKKQIYYATLLKLSSLSSGSIKCLAELIESPNTSDTVKCGASKFVLDRIINIAYYEELEKRIAKLEKK